MRFWEAIKALEEGKPVTCNRFRKGKYISNIYSLLPMLSVNRRLPELRLDSGRMMEWIDREKQFPDLDRILCYGEGEIFICEWIETKWGNFYSSICHCDMGAASVPDWTHWMPLPEPPSDAKDPIEIVPFYFEEE